MKFNLATKADMAQVVRELSNGLSKLDLNDNFTGWQITSTIAAGAELQLVNQLQSGVPTKMVIVRQTGNGLVTDSGTPWTSDFVYIKNNGSVTVTVTIIFMK